MPLRTVPALALASMLVGGPSTQAAEVHEIYPETHSRLFTADATPILRIESGDSVVTRTWDSGGRDHEDVWHIEHPYVYPESGNPLMGPFFIEGAAYGDVLEVHFDKIRLNRDHGYTTYRLNPAVLEPGATLYDRNYEMDAVRAGRADLIPWDIDLERGTASPRLQPRASSGFALELPVRPMLGCVGVAPGRGVVETSGPSYEYGGNIDYNDIVEGTTLYLPVFNEGAYLYVGDGHALQGDGEGFGAGVETSMDVQFTVRVLKNTEIRMPRLVTDEHLITIMSQPEFRSNLDIGLRAANSEMIRWLTGACELTAQEAHMLMGSVVEHKIITYSGSVATLMKKAYLPSKCHRLQ